MRKGWICLHRCIVRHWIWQDANRFKWWIDLLLRASSEDKKMLFEGVLIECKRGQLITSLNKLATEWMVNRDTVRRFLDMLESDAMITRKSTHKMTQITICNYDSYQDKPTTDTITNNISEATTNRQLTQQPTDTINNYNNITNNNIDKEKENIKEKESCKKNLATTQTKVKVFIKPSLEDVRAYCQSRGNDVDAERWYNYYSANGWKVGRNAMKDWKASVRTWENSRDKDNGNKTTTVPENNSQWRDANRQGWDFSQTDL